jgi:hypothetical protein
MSAAEIYAPRMSYRPGSETIMAEIETNDPGRVLGMCPMIDSNGWDTVITSRELAIVYGN